MVYSLDAERNGGEEREEKGLDINQIWLGWKIITTKPTVKKSWYLNSFFNLEFYGIDKILIFQYNEKSIMSCRA